MTALRIAFAWKRERDGGGPGDPAPVGRAGRREPEGADHLVELARVVVVADCRVDLVSLDLPVHPHPERDGERGAAQLFGWRVEREGHIAELRRPSYAALTSATGAGLRIASRMTTAWSSTDSSRPP